MFRDAAKATPHPLRLQDGNYLNLSKLISVLSFMKKAESNFKDVD
jgi:hypothetical protein